MSGGRLPRDTTSQVMQLWAPKRVDSVVAAAVWTPEADDRGFAATIDMNYIMITDLGVAQNEVPLTAGRPIGIINGYTYKFDTTSKIEVM